MKTKSIFAAFAVVSLSSSVAVLAESTENAPTKKMASKEAEAMKVFIVTAKGGGWGAGKAVRAAIGSQEGVKSYKMSGLRTTVFMKDGVKLDETKLKEAFNKGPVTFVSLEEKNLVVPKAIYMLRVSGTTWAIENNKARVALENLPHVATAYVNSELEIQLSEDVKLDEKTVRSELAKYKIRVKSVKKVQL